MVLVYQFHGICYCCYDFIYLFQKETPLVIEIVNYRTESLSLCEKCRYSELFWSTFFHIRTEYGEIASWTRIIPNTDNFDAVYCSKIRHVCMYVLFIYSRKKLKLIITSIEILKYKSNHK